MDGTKDAAATRPLIDRELLCHVEPRVNFILLTAQPKKLCCESTIFYDAVDLPLSVI